MLRIIIEHRRQEAGLAPEDLFEVIDLLRKDFSTAISIFQHHRSTCCFLIPRLLAKNGKQCRCDIAKIDKNEIFVILGLDPRIQIESIESGSPIKSGMTTSLSIFASPQTVVGGLKSENLVTKIFTQEVYQCAFCTYVYGLLKVVF